MKEKSKKMTPSVSGFRVGGNHISLREKPCVRACLQSSFMSMCTVQDGRRGSPGAGGGPPQPGARPDHLREGAGRPVRARPPRGEGCPRGSLSGKTLPQTVGSDSIRSDPDPKPWTFWRQI